MTLPKDLQGTAIYFAALDSTSKQVNTFEKLDQLKCFVQGATEEHNRLLKFGMSAALEPRTADLARNMAEVFGELAAALVGKVQDIRKELTAQTIAAVVAS